jgi:hypothetical protein
MSVGGARHATAAIILGKPIFKILLPIFLSLRGFFVSQDVRLPSAFSAVMQNATSRSILQKRRRTSNTLMAQGIF